jgi:hypothetical protein
VALLREPDEDRLLHVEPVPGLVEYHGALGVHDRVLHLLSPVGREAVHEYGALAGPRHELLRDAIAREESPEPGLALGLLPHADEHVGVDDVRAAHSLLRVLVDQDVSAQVPHPAHEGA